ncbi:unnamed protein product [Vicia faba]|uniref:Uncharacterized protein n=1 Tax=Vicia faba TaxID=3906 RepID=A0AAV0ZST4_VICFA|nr:unnamed protein product [Vicia faba]
MIHWMSWENLAKAKKFLGCIGFRGIAEFNLSLLGKQFWRLQRDEGSLLGRVSKSIYFPNCNILEAKVGYTPSYAWRSVFVAKELVTEGSRWRIGDGLQVYVCKENWILNSSGFKCLSDPKDSDMEMTFYDLIIHEICCWNRDLVEKLFSPGEAIQIMSIPLSMIRLGDERIWHGEADGYYSVKSAYKLISNKNVASKSGLSIHAHSNFWKKL